MASENAKAVAKDVIETVLKGKKVNKQTIQRKHGYTVASAKAMKATKTKSYKDTIDPFVQKLLKERNRLIKAMSEKNLDKVKYKDAADSFDKINKNIQLLTGGKTSNEGIEISWT